MNNRLQTDFLIPTSSFLTGFGSVLSIGGEYFSYNYSDDVGDADRIALASDWLIVGQDLRESLSHGLPPG
jgi:hypothetical protein